MTSVHVLRRVELRTPVGPMLAIASRDGLAFLEFTTRERMSRVGRRLLRWFTAWSIQDGWHPHIRVTARWLDAYFDGESAPSPELDARGTPFERRVWTHLVGLPWGTTTSYGEIASRIGHPTAARAVGAANGANPITLIVPCHRVVGQSGSLTGYGGGLDVKRWLLAHEAAKPRASQPAEARRR